MANQLFHFSFRLSIPKDKDQAFAEGEVPDFLSLVTDVFAADKYVFQLEDSFTEKTQEEKDASEHTHNLHFQGYFHVEKKVRAGKLVKLLQASKYKGWSNSLTKASVLGKAALKNYCQKPETRVAGPWADRPIYLGADLITKANMVPQQKALLNYLLQVDPMTHGRRMSLWIYCPKGGSGKSAFKKYCAFHHKWLGFTYSKSHDILYLVNKFPNRRVYFFNLSKTKSSEVSENELYAAIESIKDGDFVSTKYEPEFCLMNPCHTVIFANHLPNLAAMTRKRFKVLHWKPLPSNLLGADIEWDFECDEIDEEQCKALYAEEQALQEAANPGKRKRDVSDTDVEQMTREFNQYGFWD